MNFMAIVSMIVTFIRYIPELIKIWKEVSSLLHQISDKQEAKKTAEDIAKAVKKAKDTKDTTGLEELFGPKSFNITFKTEEKKSLELDAFQLEVRIFEQKKLAEFVQEFIESKEPINPLKDIEKMVIDTGSQYDHNPIKETFSDDMDKVAEEPKKFSMFGFGRSSSSIPGASYVNNTRMSGMSRMGSTFFVLFLVPFISGFGCAKKSINQPEYKPVIWAGDSANGGITRKQNNKFIRATDSNFDNYAAVSYNTLSCIMKTYVYNCESYKKQIVECDIKDQEFIKDYIQSK